MLDNLSSLWALSLASNFLTGDVANILGGVWGSSSMLWLNVSNNKELTLDREWAREWTDSQLLEVVAIAQTNIALTPQMCSKGVNLFASETAPHDGLVSVVESCSKAANLLDISATNATELQTSLFELTERLLVTAFSDRLSFRLQTTKSPVQCSLQQGFREEPSEKQILSFPVLEYQCHCSPGYYQREDGVCQLFWDAGRIAGLVLGCTVLVVFSTLVATLVCLRLRRRRRHLALDLDLHKGLLEESAYDVLALTRAWEIDWRDVDLTARIDQGVEGAFGEVGPYRILILPRGCFVS